LQIHGGGILTAINISPTRCGILIKARFESSSEKVSIIEAGYFYQGKKDIAKQCILSYRIEHDPVAKGADYVPPVILQKTNQPDA